MRWQKKCRLPSLTAVIQRDEGWFVSTCPELGVASQGKSCKEAYAMLAEAVELWLEAASAKEIKRRLKLGGSVQPLQLAHAQSGSDPSSGDLSMRPFGKAPLGAPCV